MGHEGIRARPTRHHFGRTASHVHHQEAFAGEIARGATEGQRRFALARYDGERHAVRRQEHGELFGIARVAGGRRRHGHRLDGRMLSRAKPGKHALEVVDGLRNAFHGLGLQDARRVHALAQVRDDILPVQFVQT